MDLSQSGGGGALTGVKCSAQAPDMDPTGSKTFEKGGLKDLKRVEIGGLKDLNRVIEANCQAWVLNC